MDMARVAVIATLDTKGGEAEFLRSCLEELGHDFGYRAFGAAADRAGYQPA